MTLLRNLFNKEKVNKDFMYKFGMPDIHFKSKDAMKTFYTQSHYVKNPNIKETDIDELVNSDNPIVTSGLSSNPIIKEHHIDKLINKTYNHFGLSYNPNLTSSHIARLLKYGNYTLNINLSQHPNFNQSHMDVLLNSGDYKNRIVVAHSPYIQPHHISDLKDDKSSTVRGYLLANPVVPDHIKTYIESTYKDNRIKFE